LRLIDYFFIPPRRLRRGSCARARHLDLKRGTTRFTNDVPAGAGRESLYNSFNRHEKNNGKLNEIYVRRRCGLHLYLHRIYFLPQHTRGGRTFLPKATSLGPWGVGPSRGARDAGEKRSPVLHAKGRISNSPPRTGRPPRADWRPPGITPPSAMLPF